MEEEEEEEEEGNSSANQLTLVIQGVLSMKNLSILSKYG